MMSAMLIAGIVAILMGLAAVAYGIPVKEFSFGNTMIFVGAMAACTGLVLIGMSVVVAELKNIGRRLSSSPRPAAEPRARPGLPPPSTAPMRPAAAEGGFLFSRDEPVGHEAEGGMDAPAPPVSPLPPISPLPWQDDNGPRERGRPQLAPLPEPVAEAAPLPPKPRNPLFSSRRERERAQPRVAEPMLQEARVQEARGAPAPDPMPMPAPPQSPFDDAWPPKQERAPLRRGRRAQPAPFSEDVPADQPAVTVVKSGVVDGMAYSLFSDGSIEAQMPEGMMRFGSIEELRAHLEQRP